LSAAVTSAAETVTVCSMPTASIAWCARLRCCVRDTAPQIATTGSPSVVAVSSPVARLAVPGPLVTSTTPGMPVSRPTAAAMKTAFCSVRHVISCGAPATPCTAASASKTGSILAPGTPNTHRTPWAMARPRRDRPRAAPGRVEATGAPEDDVGEWRPWRYS
jgi:hypothetical protein